MPTATTTLSPQCLSYYHVRAWCGWGGGGGGSAFRTTVAAPPLGWGLPVGLCSGRPWLSGVAGSDGATWLLLLGDWGR